MYQSSVDQITTTKTRYVGWLLSSLLYRVSFLLPATAVLFSGECWTTVGGAVQVLAGCHPGQELWHYY